MSDVSSSSNAAPPTSGASRVTPAPVTPGQTGQQQTPSQGDPHAKTTAPAPPPSTAVTLAPTLAGFSEGEAVAVTVVGQDAGGRQIVQAAQSVLVTLDPETLPDQGNVTIRVTAIAHDHLRAQVVSVDGETAANPHNIRLRLVQVSFPQTTPETAGPNPQSLPTASTAAPLQEGAIVQAQLLPASAALPAVPATSVSSSRPTAPSILPSQGPVTFFRIVSATPPTATASSGATPQPPTTEPATTIRAAASTTVAAGGSNSASITGPAQIAGAPPAASAASATTRGVGSRASNAAAAAAGVVQRPAPGYTPTGSAPAPTGSTAGNPVPAQVSGVITTAAGPNQTVITTTSGKIVLSQPAPTNWPNGTALVLETVEIRPDAPIAPTAQSMSGASVAARPLDQILMTLGEDWPALRDLAKHTATAAPATAQAFVDGKVPAANARAAAQIMFFLSVLRSGDLTGWLGADMMRSLERSGQRGLVERLGDDFRQLRRLGDEAGANDWRLLLFPFAEGDRIEPIHMFVRGQRRDQTDGEQDIRFVVDLKMSALGALQFDGLLHRQTFDLMVRSHTDLSEVQRGDITKIFNTGLEAINYRGQVAFQTVREFPVSPFNDLLGGSHTPGAIVA